MNQEKPGLVGFLLRNPVFANILMITIFAGGILGGLSLVRESFPDVALDIIQVSVPYPGADPDDVEEGICKPLENALSAVSGSKRVFTIASEGGGSAIIEVREGADPSRVKDDVKTLVDSISTFPDNAERPLITDVNIERDVLNVMLYGTLSERQLKELGKEIKDEIETLPSVSQVGLFGARDYEVSIEFSEEKLRQYGISMESVATILRANSLNLPAGSLKGTNEELKLRIFGERYYGVDFEDTVIATNAKGGRVLLKDIAHVRDSFDRDAEFYGLFNGHRCIRLQVKKNKEEDSLEISESITDYLAEKRASLPKSVHLETFFDMSRMVDDRLNLLKWNGILGLLLVFINLWIFLDLRLSIWVTMGIPISISGALMFMHATGASMNMISMFGLIMVLGIIVDDAIVVGEAIYFHRSRGENALASATKGVKEVWWPVIAAVLTTVVAFLPMFFIQGIMGKFIGVLPVPVVAALLVSLVEALFILPVHLRHLPPVIRPRSTAGSVLKLPSTVRKAISNGLMSFCHNVYGPLIRRLLNLRYLVAALAFALCTLTVGLHFTGQLPWRFFPKVDGDFLVAQIEMPQGTPIEVTEAASRHLLDAWEKTEEEFKSRLKPYTPSLGRRIRNFVLRIDETDQGDDLKLAKGMFTLVGGSQGRHRTSSGAHLSSLRVELMPAERRNVHYMEILKVWRTYAEPIPGASKVTFPSIAGGPPGDNIQVEFRGRDMHKLIATSEEFMTHLRTFTSVYDVESSYLAGKRELRVGLKEEGRVLGLTLRELAQQLRHGFYGNEVKRVQRDGDEVKVMLRFPDADRSSEAFLESLMIRTVDGRELPFATVAQVSRVQGYASIRREGGSRVVSVTAKVTKGDAAEDVQKAIVQDFLPELCSRHGIRFGLGAEVMDRKKSMKSMFFGLLFALLGIFLLMATVFKSYLQPFIIMLTIPFGIAGAMIGHLVYGFIMNQDMPITFFSLMGMIALTGIVVNDSIVLIVAVNDRIRQGVPIMTALREAGIRRFRAIILTTMTTFIGLFPLLLERSFQAQILIPMALSVAVGVIFGTCATLIIIPCLLCILNDLRRLFHLARYLRWPSREEVELTELLTTEGPGNEE